VSTRSQESGQSSNYYYLNGQRKTGNDEIAANYGTPWRANPNRSELCGLSGLQTATFGVQDVSGGADVEGGDMTARFAASPATASAAAAAAAAGRVGAALAPGPALAATANASVSADAVLEVCGASSPC
jgi:hypothetical protein